MYSNASVALTKRQRCPLWMFGLEDCILISEITSPGSQCFPSMRYSFGVSQKQIAEKKWLMESNHAFANLLVSGVRLEYTKISSLTWVPNDETLLFLLYIFCCVLKACYIEVKQFWPYNVLITIQKHSEAPCVCLFCSIRTYWCLVTTSPFVSLPLLRHKKDTFGCFVQFQRNGNKTHRTGIEWKEIKRVASSDKLGPNCKLVLRHHFAHKVYKGISGYLLVVGFALETFGKRGKPITDHVACLRASLQLFWEVSRTAKLLRKLLSLELCGPELLGAGNKLQCAIVLGGCYFSRNSSSTTVRQLQNINLSHVLPKNESEAC